MFRLLFSGEQGTLQALYSKNVTDFKPKVNAGYNIAHALVLSNSDCAIMNKIQVYAYTAELNKMACALLKKLQNFRRVRCKFLLCKFRQCEDYSEQSKPYFEPLTFAWQR